MGAGGTLTGRKFEGGLLFLHPEDGHIYVSVCEIHQIYILYDMLSLLDVYEALVKSFRKK